MAIDILTILMMLTANLSANEFLASTRNEAVREPSTR